MSDERIEQEIAFKSSFSFFLHKNEWKNKKNYTFFERNPAQNQF